MDEKLRGMLSELKGTGRSNAVAINCYTIYSVVLLGGYIVEVIKKSRTIAYFLIFSVLTLIPLVLAHIVYRGKKENENIKYIVIIGYAFSYLYTIFTTVSPVAFVYAALIGLIMLVYADMKLSICFGAGLFVANVSNVIYMSVTDKIASEDMPNIEIRIAFSIVYAVFLVMTTRTIIKNNEYKMSHISKENAGVTPMLESIMEISENMIGNILVVSEKMEVLEDSVVKTMESMQEVANGTNDTADSVQTQLIKTEEIQNFIRKVEEVSGTIESDMEDTNQQVQVGKDKIDELINQVKISDDASNEVSEELGRLTRYTSQMQTIIEMIDGITSQTSLLSLNASIEAARVGEAGKGFAVVASEISNLAEQTQSATVDITELINNISTELEAVVKVVNYLMDNSKMQSIAATETASSFETIASRTEDIQQFTEELTGLVTELASSNESIVDSIQTISSATEEVTAHSSVTLESSEENASIVNEVGDIVNELQVLAQRLNEFEM